MFQTGEVETYCLQVDDIDNGIIRATLVIDPFPAHMVSMSISNNLLERT